jgi:hypothetical protein
MRRRGRRARPRFPREPCEHAKPAPAEPSPTALRKAHRSKGSGRQAATARDGQTKDLPGPHLRAEATSAPPRAAPPHGSPPGCVPRKPSAAGAHSRSPPVAPLERTRWRCSRPKDCRRAAGGPAWPPSAAPGRPVLRWRRWSPRTGPERSKRWAVRPDRERSWVRIGLCRGRGRCCGLAVALPRARWSRRPCFPLRSRPWRGC